MSQYTCANIAGGIQSLIIKKSSNVILAKVRALYGKSLKTQDFSNMVNCHSVGEVAAYLKNTDAYGSALSEINESTVHRGHLEQLLRRKMFEEFISLGRYDAAGSAYAYRYLVTRSEIELIISCMRLLNGGKAGDIIFAMPLFFTSHVHIDIYAMSKCSDYAELLSALEHTRYYKILRRFFPVSDSHIPITEVETALYTELAYMSHDIISHAGGNMRKELEELLFAQTDAQNVNRIQRLKEYFGAAPKEINDNLLPRGTLSKRTMESMVNAATAREVTDIFLSTCLGRRLPRNQRMSIYDLHQRVPYFNARRYIHYSSYPIVVLFSYLIIKDVEINDITNVIEGIRYGLPPERIKDMLVPIS